VYLLVVESPNKISRLGGILGAGWKIVSTKGHLEDLPTGKLGGKKILREDGQIVEIPRSMTKRVEFGIDVSDGFKPFYTIVQDKEATVKQISVAVDEAERVYVATDPDREGEAIAWSVAKLVGGRAPVHRVKFNAITESEVTRAMQNPVPIDHRLVRAAHARRVLDRLIGFFISPLADAAVNQDGREYRYTVGRVQSPALAMITDALQKRMSFKPKNAYRLRIDYDFYGTVGAAASSAFYVTALSRNTFMQKAEAYEAAGAARKLVHTVKSMKSLRHTVNPPRALKTSSMQARAFMEKGLPAAVSSQSAQSMFQRGLITYPRTDSERVSAEGKDIATRRIMDMYGEKYVGFPPDPPLGEFGQGAHEAVRPALAKVERFRTDEEKALYGVVDKYFIASRMSPAQVNQTTVVMSCPLDEFTAQFRTIHNDGFTRHTKDTAKLLKGYSIPPSVLRDIKPGMRVGGLNVSVVEEADRPPRVHDEASLILACEKEGIGRPSTYPEITKKLKERGYVDEVDMFDLEMSIDDDAFLRDPATERAVNFLETSPRGRKVLDYLSEEHPWVVDRGFTREVEHMLDGIATGEMSYSEVVGVVWAKLVETVPDVAFYSNDVQSGMGMSPA